MENEKFKKVNINRSINKHQVELNPTKYVGDLYYGNYELFQRLVRPK